MTLSKKRLAVAAVIASVALGTGPLAQAQVKNGRSRSTAGARSAPVLVNFHPQVGATAGSTGAPAGGQVGGASGAGAAGGPGGTGAGTAGAAVAGSAGALPGAASGQPSTGATSSVGGLQLPAPGITGGGGASGAAAGQAGGGFGAAGSLGAAQVDDLPPASSGRLAPIMMQGVREPIGAVDISVEQIGTQVIPEDQAAKHIAGVMALPGGEERGFGCITYRWQAANIEHWPLYFEDPMLERHGQQRCGPVIQPAVSGAKFLGNIVLYPYKAALWPACESRYTLGHFRPGSPAPLLRDTLPWSPRAALVEGAAVTGVFVGLPW